MAPTLAQLLSPATVAQVKAKLLSALQSYSATNPLPITDWREGGVERSIVEIDAVVLQELVSSVIPLITAGGYVGLADEDWLPLLAYQVYLLTQNEASFTQGTELLTCSGDAGPYTITAGQLWFIAQSGNRYVNITGGTLSTGGTLEITIQSEKANDSTGADPVNYVDAADTITTMATPLAGVTCNNPADDFAEVVQTGSGTGVVTPSATPDGPHTIIVRIDVAGQAGLAEWSYSLDGEAFVSAGNESEVEDIGSSGITVTLSDGDGDPSFTAGDTYTIVSPGTWITQQGTDLESKEALVSRCQNRWPSLAAITQSIPTLGFYDLLARQASEQVTQTRVVTDGTINNKVLIYVAGQAGILPTSVVTTVREYITARVGLTDMPVVGSPVARAIILGGATAIVRTSVATKASAQAFLQAEIQSYINSVGINGKVRHGAIVALFEATPGIEEFTDTELTINGSTEDLQLPVTEGLFEIAQWSQSIASAIVWGTL